MKKIDFALLSMAVVFLFVSSITGWAYIPPTPREPQPDQELADGQTSRPPSSYDVQESPLSQPVVTEEVQPEQVRVPTPDLIEPVKNTPPITVDISQGMNAVQEALDQLPKNGTLEISGQGTLTSDSLRIPAGATINLGQDVSLVLGDLKAGNLPVEVNVGSMGAGTSMIASSSTAEITGGGSILLTVDGLKADIQQLQKNLRAAATAQARKEIRESIQRDRERVREIRQANLKSIHKKSLPAVHRQARKK